MPLHQAQPPPGHGCSIGSHGGDDRLGAGGGSTPGMVKFLGACPIRPGADPVGPGASWEVGPSEENHRSLVARRPDCPLVNSPCLYACEFNVQIEGFSRSECTNSHSFAITGGGYPVCRPWSRSRRAGSRKRAGEDPGKQVRHAEAFEICEYGRRPSPSEHRSRSPSRFSR